MRLYLVQHGAAKTEAEDPQRGLTDEGRLAVERMAEFLAPLRLALDRIEHSDKLRARQTAELLAARLRRTLSSTNSIESCLSTVERVARNVKRWREGDQSLRWTATGLLEAEKRFNRVKGYREIGVLNCRLNSSTIQEEEVNRERVA